MSLSRRRSTAKKKRRECRFFAMRQACVAFKARSGQGVASGQKKEKAGGSSVSTENRLGLEGGYLRREELSQQRLDPGR